MSSAITMLVALVIFAVTYVLIITEWINKMLASLIGGFLLVMTGILTQGEAFLAVDWNVIFFLLGMMLVISVLKKTGVFMYVAIKTAKLVRGHPLAIMMLLFCITAFFSAFLDSVTAVMIWVPVAMLICHELNISPVPFIITMAVASNMGGAATMVGDPPNVILGSAIDKHFMDFMINLTPASLLSVLASLGLIILLFRKKLYVSQVNRAKLMSYKEERLITDKRMLVISLTVLGAMLLALAFDGVLKLGTASISMSAALILMVISNRKNMELVLAKDIDWITLLFFMGLFILVEGLVKTGFINILANRVIHVTQGKPRLTSMAILWISGIFSAVVDNVPFVATMIPVLKQIAQVIQDPKLMDPIWWSLSLGTCLGGNGTLIGASANIVSVGIAKQNGFHISFKEFTKISVIFTFVSLLTSTAYILLRYY
ncbi:MAG: ArsB/NhaD family transporter [Candidatus Cloacimonadaceae bacterium]|nr:ArsB/NhaD family transporter [Candidatus Cloacimonadota bacterium]